MNDMNESVNRMVLGSARARRVLTTPTVSFSTLAKVMGGLSTKELVRVLHAHKYPTGGPARSYQLARQQAIDLFVDNKPLDPGAPLRPYEREVVCAMQRARLRPVPRVRSVRAIRRAQRWKLRGVEISMHADVEFESYVEAGAAKFSFTKKALPRGVGTAMAALLWYWKSVVLGKRNVSPAHCVVYEPRLPRIHLPGRKPATHLKEAEHACTMIAALWPAL